MTLCPPEMQESIIDDLDNGGDSGTENQQQQCTCNMHLEGSGIEECTTDADYLISLHSGSKD